MFYPIKELRDDLLTQVVIKDLFDFYRIVDPLTHTVYRNSGSGLEQSDEKCYEVWNNFLACVNCISSCAVCENRKFMKLEYLDGRILQVVSYPVRIEGKMLALELGSDLTDDMYQQQTTLGEDANKALNAIRDFNELAVRDMQSGLYNKLFTQTELERLQTIYQSNHSQLAAIYLDVDSFKAVNDTHGHLIGDGVIEMISESIRKVVRVHQGWAGRLGGDEFLLVFPEKDAAFAHRAVRELESDVISHQFKGRNGLFSVQISCGVAVLDANKSVEQFLDEIDVSMYAVKNQKRLAD